MAELRVVLAGDEAAGCRVLSMLERSALHLVAVAAKLGNADQSTSLAARAAAIGVPTLDACRLRTPDVVPELATHEPDVLLNVHSLHKVHGEVLDLFPVGAWNLHPGPLPEAAGINVPSWAIANGHQSHGVTVHTMTADYDEGDIAYEDRFPIEPTATGLSLSIECGRRGLALIRCLIDQLADDPAGVPRSPQDLTKRRLYPLGQPNDGIVDWSSPAAVIEAQVRAADFRPFPGPWSTPEAAVGDQTLLLHAVEIGGPTDRAPGAVSRTEDGPLVAAADRWVRILESEPTT